MQRFKSSCPVLAALLLALSRGADGFAVPVRMSSRSQTSLRAGEASAAPVQSSAEGHTEELPQALIFDCDGVLADTERDGHRPAFNAAFKIKNLGACLDHDDVMRDQNIKLQVLNSRLCCVHPIVPVNRVFRYSILLPVSTLRTEPGCEWDVERYGKLLSVGGGKERMTAHWDGGLACLIGWHGLRAEAVKFDDVLLRGVTSDENAADAVHDRARLLPLSQSRGPCA